MKFVSQISFSRCVLAIVFICGCSPDKNVAAERQNKHEQGNDSSVLQSPASLKERCYAKRHDLANIKDKAERTRRVKEFCDATLSMPLDRSTLEQHAYTLDVFIYTAEAAFGAILDLDVDDPTAWDFLLKSINRCLEEIKLAEKSCPSVEKCSTSEEKTDAIVARDIVRNMRSWCEDAFIHKHIDFTAGGNLEHMSEDGKKEFVESCKRIIGRYPTWYKNEIGGDK